MKISKLNGNLYRLLTILLITVVFSSCAKTLRFNISPVIPSATGSVKLSTDDNKNRAMTLSVKNLVDPQRLTPPKKIYVVWIQTKDGVRNLGSLVSSEGYFTSTRTATFTSVITGEPTRFFVTAEDNAQVAGPGSVTVLTTNEF
ncbi:MAG: hypothetical protein WKF66_00040 [Pedobacter sp.]